MSRLFPIGRPLFLILTFAVVLIALGCARPTGSIKGKVSYDGKILKNGNISFVSTEGQNSASAQIMEDGTYDIPKITSGNYKVVVETESYNPKTSMKKDSFGKDNMASKQNPPPGKEPKQSGPADPSKIPEGYHASNPAEAAAIKAGERFTQIPEKFQKADSTPLTYTAVQGSQTHDIDLPK